MNEGESKINFAEVAVTGLKILAGIASGIAAFCGLGKLFKKCKTNNQNSNDEGNPNSYGACSAGQQSSTNSSSSGEEVAAKVQKVVNVLGVVQVVASSAVNVVRSLVSVASTVSSMFDKGKYQTIMNQTNGYQPQGMFMDGVNYPAGNYPWNPGPDVIPANQIVSVGNDPSNYGQGIYCVNKSDCIEIW